LSHKAKLADSLVYCSTSFLIYLLSDYYFLRERQKFCGLRQMHFWRLELSITACLVWSYFWKDEG